MKKVIFGTLFLGLVGLGIVGCKKENGNLNNNDDYIPSVPYLKSINGNDIVAINGILKFKDFSHVNNVIKSLEVAYEEREEIFLSQFPDYNGEKLMAIEDSLGYDDLNIFHEFSSMYQYESLFSKTQGDQEEYERKDIEMEIEPDDHFVIDYETRTILNSQEEIIVGDTIYKFYEGGYIAIPNEDFSILSDIRINVNNIKLYKTINIFGDVTKDGSVETEDEEVFCPDAIGWKVKSKTKPYTSTKRIKYKVGIRTWPWDRIVLAKSINQYRKKNKGAWKKIRVHTKVQVYGDVLEFGVDENGAYVDCDNKISFNTNGSNKFAEKYKTKTLKHKVTDVPTKTRSSWVKGYHRSYMDETL